MGFGSYDEGEQERREFDTDFDEEDSVETGEHAYEGAVEFESGASNEDLLSQLQEIKDDAEEETADDE